MTIDPSALDVRDTHHLFTSCISPRPIAWVSSINKKDEVNLSPFSFFNFFSIKPPILIFSPCLSGRDGSAKDTLLNVKEVPEVVIHIVTPDMMIPMDITSQPFPRGVNEFEKAGLTMVPSEVVRPPGMHESPVRMECKVNEVMALGQDPGAGNLVICEVIRMHVKDEWVDTESHIDRDKVSLLSRGGGPDYFVADQKSKIQVPRK